MDLTDIMQQVETFWPLIVGIPAVGSVFISLTIKAGRGWRIIRRAWAMIRDGIVTDKEMATIAWMLVSVVFGFWPNASRRVLIYAPDDQKKLLEEEGFLK